MSANSKFLNHSLLLFPELVGGTDDDEDEGISIDEGIEVRKDQGLLVAEVSSEGFFDKLLESVNASLLKKGKFKLFLSSLNKI